MKPLTARELEWVTLAAPLADENTARALLERLRWLNGVVCPHCRRRGAYALTAKADSQRPVREGVWKCKSCRRQFTVRLGTFFEDSRIPLSKWVMAVFIICASGGGITSKQLERMLDISYTSAWFMSRDLHHAMSAAPFRKILSRSSVVGKRHSQRRRTQKNRRKVGSRRFLQARLAHRPHRND